jgi:hypothetical protein
MDKRELFYPETRFGGFTDIDGTMAFFNRVNSLLDSSFVVLDVGCGRGEYHEDEVCVRRNLRNLRGKSPGLLELMLTPALQVIHIWMSSLS